MKTILVDDEYLALNYLEHQLLKVSGGAIEIIGKFIDPIEAKGSILREDADVVFLDIHLPEVNGIELATRILESKPKLNIVFVTAYDKYAIQAFELNALDYVLKPVESERLLKTVQRLQARLEEASVSPRADKETIRMNLFQQVSIESGDQFTTMRWRTTRVQELFLYLLQHRGQLVRKSTLIELLWPEYETGRAYAQLYTSVYHIRKTLEPYGDHFTISNATEGYILTIGKVALDVAEWESRIQSGLPITNETIEDYEKAMDLYAGDYLQEFEYWWAECERQRLKLLWLRTSYQLAEFYLSCSLRDKAIEKYIEICDRHPQAEEAHFALMQIYAAANNRISVHRQYRLLSAALAEELSELPSMHISVWYDNWKRDNKE
ncbi:response regulator [Paenibacillus harenae]|uniref:response regulator n=1 Tax=Paenibacillus harenae TaxID=306543 RepID=UPI0003FB29DA|nr:response regulator [Paenibacillus harenae]